MPVKSSLMQKISLDAMFRSFAFTQSSMFLNAAHLSPPLVDRKFSTLVSPGLHCMCFHALIISAGAVWSDVSCVSWLLNQFVDDVGAAMHALEASERLVMLRVVLEDRLLGQ